ncbi:transposase, partial [Burkholderia ubonensis]|uniref:transposase n=1 Tax=Burkholderia ubonensis TaxID=101571 RepID=UPI001E63C9FB
ARTLTLLLIVYKHSSIFRSKMWVILRHPPGPFRFKRATTQHHPDYRVSRSTAGAFLLAERATSAAVSRRISRDADSHSARDGTAISGSLTLLTNLVIAWNTQRMQATVDGWRRKGRQVDDEWLRRMGPAHFAHVNFRGTLSFPIDQYSDVLLEAAPWQRGTGS